MQLPTIQQNQELQQAVDAKELYQSLGLDITHWSRWHIKNIAENPFATDGVDFVGFAIMASGNQTQNYLISLDFAKKLAMQVRTEMGERIRDYFLECEQRASQPAISLPQDYISALEELLITKKSEQLALEQLASAQPKIDFHDKVAASSSTMAVSDVAKKIGLSAQALNIKLVELGAYDKRRLPKKVFNDTFIKKGYAEMSLTADGYDRNRLTQAGQIYITNLLGSTRQLGVTQ